MLPFYPDFQLNISTTEIAITGVALGSLFFLTLQIKRYWIHQYTKPLKTKNGNVITEQPIIYVPSQQLTNIEIDVLDCYDKSNIKIPTEIIEDLHSRKLSSHKEIFDFIENQRYFWKLENTKKVYKGDMNNGK